MSHYPVAQASFENARLSMIELVRQKRDENPPLVLSKAERDLRVRRVGCLLLSYGVHSPVRWIDEFVKTGPWLPERFAARDAATYYLIHSWRHLLRIVLVFNNSANELFK